MLDIRNGTQSPATGADERQSMLRQLGGRAHQLTATSRAADHFNGLDATEERDTASWLVSCALMQSTELSADIDGLARSMKDSPVEAPVGQAVQALRVQAHQLRAVARAADHFLDRDARGDRESATWLIACALALSQRLAAGLDDCAAPVRRRVAPAAAASATPLAPEVNDVVAARRAAGSAQPPLRGAA